MPQIALIAGYCLLLAMLPLISLPDGLPHDAWRLLQLLAGLLLLGTSVVSACRRGFRTAVPPSPTLLGLGVLGALSVACASRPEFALREYCLLLVALLAVWPRAPSHGALSAKTQQIAIHLLIAGAALYAALELLLISLGLVLNHTLDYWRVFAGYLNPRFFNHVQTLLIPLLAGMLGLPELRMLWRRIAWFALIVNSFLLLLLMGRATLLALMVSSFLMLLLFKHLARQHVVRLLLAFAAGGLLHLLLIQLLPWLIGMEALPAFREIGERGSVEARLYLWQIALDMIAAHPWLGVGPMHYSHQFNGEAAHPHNIYLQVAAEYGLPFFFLLAFLVLRWLIRTTRALHTHLHQAGDSLALAGYAALIAALVDGGFSGNFVMPLSQIWIVIALILLRERLPPLSHADPVPRSYKQSVAGRTCMAILFVTQVGIVSHSLSEFIHPPVRLERAMEPPDANYFSPRFWSDGWF